MPNALSQPVPKPVLLALCLLAGIAPAGCATLESLPLTSLITRAGIIVQGTVTGTSASFTGSAVYTHYKFSVSRPFKGSPPAVLDVQIPGGSANGIRQVVPGTPQLVAGQPYVLFLWTSRKGTISTLGFTQGVFSLQTDAAGKWIASQMPTTETVLSPATGQPVNNPPVSMPLDQLIAAIAAGGSN